MLELRITTTDKSVPKNDETAQILVDTKTVEVRIHAILLGFP